MLTSSDLLRLPYTPDLTEGGIAYALRSLTHSFFRAGSSPYARLRRTVASVAVELAFRRHLSQQNIPFEVKAATPFTDHERYDVILGGHRCDLKSYLISHRAQIAEIRRNPSVLLNAPALVPSDQHAGDGHSPNDLYLFAFLSGLIAASQADLKKAITTKQPHYLVHAMPEEWRKPLNWNPLGALTLKSDSEEELLIEISGQDEGRELKRCTVSLLSKTKIMVNESFYSLASVHVRRMPDARVGLHCQAVKEAHIISPLEWGNIWVYGMEIFLAGFISRVEFSRRANPLLPNSKVFQYEHTRVKNLSLPVSNLKPVQDLPGTVHK
ncbi:MAG: hypothetical protein ACYC6R_03820 [Anaerolineales bacterium]